MLKVSKNELAGALAALGKLVCRTSPQELYRTIRLRSEGTSLRLTTVNLNESLSAELDAEADEPLDRIVNFAELKDAVKGSYQGMVTFHEKDGLFSVLVESGRNALARVLSKTDVEWPEDPVVPADVKPAALPEGFVSMLATAARVVDRNNIRKSLQGIHLSRDGIAATNGHELWVEQTYLETDPLTLPFPLALLATKEQKGGWLTTWGTEADSLQFRVNVGRWEWYGRALPGTYPRWERVIPQYSSKAVHVRLNQDHLEQVRAFLKRSVGEQFLLTAKGTDTLEIKTPNSSEEGVQINPQITGSLEPCGIALARPILEHWIAENHTTLVWENADSPIMATGGSGLLVAMPLRIKAEEPAVTGTAIEPYKSQKEENMNKVENTVVSAPVAQAVETRVNPEVVTNPLDDLNSAIEDFRQKIKAMFEESNTLARKGKEVALQQKQKERDFIQAKRAIERIRMAI